MQAFKFIPGTQPLLISMPHVGTYLPPALAARLTPTARQVHDTDWHLERLYSFAQELSASVLIATHSRYVIDLNRDPSGASLYPGQSVTGLCPVDDFDNQPLYQDPADVPSEAEIALRRDTLWQPYHQQLHAELARIRAVHGKAVLWDAHSIRSVVPRFFEGWTCWIGPRTWPREKLCRHSKPSRQTVTSRRSLRALTTEAPTPCRPPVAL